MGMFPPTLGRYCRRGPLEDFQQRLLHALAGDIASDRWVLTLACDLVDLVDVDDAGLGPLDVVVGGLDQLQQDVLDVLTDVARLGQCGGVGDRKRHVEHPCQRLCHVRLAAAGGTDEQDVGFGQLDFTIEAAVEFDPLVVVVDGDRQNPLRLILTDDVVVQE